MWRILGNLLSTFATWTYSHPFWTLYRFRSNNRLKKLEDALVKTSATTRWHCLHLGSPQKERVNKKQKYFASIISAFILHLLEKIRYVTGTQPSTSQTLPPLSSSIPVMPSPLNNNITITETITCEIFSFPRAGWSSASLLQLTSPLPMGIPPW